MQQLQISRGKLEVRALHKALLNGELFLDYTHGSKYDDKNLTYELFAGCNGEAIKIGGQGVLSFIRALDANENLPTDPIKGGIYYVTHDIQIGNGNNTVGGTDIPEFREGDLAIYVGEDLHRDSLPLPDDNLFESRHDTPCGRHAHVYRATVHFRKGQCLAIHRRHHLHPQPGSNA